MEKNINLKDRKLLDISIFLFMLFPLLFLMYLYIISNRNIVEFISNDIRITLSFISVMTMPFCGLICKEIKKEIIDLENFNLALGKLFILLLSQILIFNIITLVVLLFTFLNLYKKTNFKSLFKYIVNNKSQFINSFLILIFSIFYFILGFKLL